MKETVYRCNRCHKLINGTVHRIGVTDEKGEQTRYGALFDNTDLCDSCMEKVTMAAITEIERNENAAGQQPAEARQDAEPMEHRSVAEQRGDKRQQDPEPEGQQDEETTEILNVEPITYQCSKVIKTCGYAEKVGGALTCNYIGIEGHRRGCDPETCNKYKRADLRKRGRKPNTAAARPDSLSRKG